MVWTTKGIDCFNPTTLNVKIQLYKFPSSTYSPDCYFADFCKYISSIIEIQSREKEPFHKVFLTLLTQQHHFIEYYLTMTKIVLEAIKVLFVKKACNVVFHRGDIDGKVLPKPGVQKEYKIRGERFKPLAHYALFVPVHIFIIIKLY